MAHINAEEGGRVYFYPFCSNGFFDLAQECVGCSFAKTAGLAIERNGSLYFPFNGSLCNPSVTEFPLPLYKCSICNRRLLNAALAYIIVVSLLTILGNGWSILVWIRIQKRPQVLFKLSLAISDFLFGAILLPFAAVDLGKTMYAPNMEYYSFSTYTGGIGSRDDYERNWEALFSPFHHHFAALILYVSQGASLCSVMLLNIDRHIAITRSINYQRIMTKSKSIAIVIGMWVVVAVLGFVTTFACGTYITQPFALFLPIVEPGNDMQELFKILCIYLLPISLVFFGNCVVAVYTSIKIYKLSKAEERPFFVSSRRSTMNQLKTSSLFKYLMEKSGRKTNNNNLSPHDYSGNLTQEKTVNNDSLKVPNLEIVVPPLDSKVVNPKSHNFSAPVVTADVIEEQNQQGENEKSNLSKQSSSFSAVTVLSRRNEYKSATCTLILILVSYALCVLPLTLCLFIYVIDEHARHENDDNNKEVFNESIYDAFAISVAIFMLSSLRNCIIYSLRNREYRASSRKILRDVKSKLCSFCCHSSFTRS